MKPDLKAKWVAALRSRRYRQGQHRLKQEDLKGKVTFCCLGVLHDIADGKWGKSVMGADRMLKYPIVYGKYHRTIFGFLPDPQRQKYGLSAKAHVELVEMNDTGKRFSEIAKWIEKNL